MMIKENWYEAEEIKCFGISNNANSRKQATITEFDSLKFKDAQSILESC